MSVPALAVLLFASTNLDDLFVLIGFFADPSYRTREIALGQFLGLFVLVAASLAASLIALVLEPAQVGLLGLLPIALGAKCLFERAHDDDADEAPSAERPASLGRMLAVAGVTVANGGDNLGIYTPVFAGSGAARLAIILAVFAAMVAVWLAVAHWLVHHPALGAPIRRYGGRLTPFVLIGLGLFVLHEAGSFGLLAGLVQ